MTFFIDQDNATEDIVCKMVVRLSRPSYINFISTMSLEHTPSWPANITSNDIMISRANISF